MNFSVLPHEETGAGALDFFGDFPVHVRRDTSSSTGVNFATFSDELAEQLDVFVVNVFYADIDPAPWHCAVGAPKVNSAL